MVTSPTGKGVIVIGGSTAPFVPINGVDKIGTNFENWTFCASLAIPIPDELVNKIVESEDKEQDAH